MIPGGPETGGEEHVAPIVAGKNGGMPDLESMSGSALGERLVLLQQSRVLIGKIKAMKEFASQGRFATRETHYQLEVNMEDAFLGGLVISFPRFVF